MTTIRQALKTTALSVAAREGWRHPSVSITWASKTTENVTVHLQFAGEPHRRYDVEGVLARAFAELHATQSTTAQADWPEIDVAADVALGDVGFGQGEDPSVVIDPTPEGSPLEHTHSMDPPCKIHSFTIKNDGHPHTWTHIRIMRVGFRDAGDHPVGALWSQVDLEDWALVPTHRHGCYAPDSVAALRDVAAWVLARRGYALEDAAVDTVEQNEGW
jgi:hypothetical protein